MCVFIHTNQKIDFCLISLIFVLFCFLWQDTKQLLASCARVLAVFLLPPPAERLALRLGPNFLFVPFFLLTVNDHWPQFLCLPHLQGLWKLWERERESYIFSTSLYLSRPFCTEAVDKEETTLLLLVARKVTRCLICVLIFRWPVQ